MTRSLIRNNLRGMQRTEQIQKQYTPKRRRVYFRNQTIGNKSLKEIKINRNGKVRTYYVSMKKGNAIFGKISNIATESGYIFGTSSFGFD